MDVQLSLPERSALLALMYLVDEASNAAITEKFGFTIDKKSRERLAELGFLTYRRGTDPGKPFVHELTDLGWRRCQEELASSTPQAAHKAYRLAYPIFNQFAAYMRRSGIQMADVFAHQEAPAAVDVEAVDVDGRIRATYVELATEPEAWVNLNRVRTALADLSRDDVDQALLRLDLQPQVYLIPESNQKTLTDAERAASIRIGGEDKHLLSIEST
jgi:hypothetical protein